MQSSRTEGYARQNGDSLNSTLIPGTISTRGASWISGSMESTRLAGEGSSLLVPDVVPLGSAPGCMGPGPGGGMLGRPPLPRLSLWCAEMRCSRTASFWILGAMPRSFVGFNSMPAVPTCLMCTCGESHVLSFARSCVHSGSHRYMTGMLPILHGWRNTCRCVVPAPCTTATCSNMESPEQPFVYSRADGLRHSCALPASSIFLYGRSYTCSRLGE